VVKLRVKKSQTNYNLKWKEDHVYIDIDSPGTRRGLAFFLSNIPILILRKMYIDQEKYRYVTIGYRGQLS
jgi:hypothetical protein